MTELPGPDPADPGARDSGGPLRQRYGSARHPGRPAVHPRPPGATDADVAALGKLSESLEVVENARGLLYGWHRLSGMADLALQEAVRMLRDAGHVTLADDVQATLVGRDTVDGRWSFQIVEAYDDGYWEVFRAVEQHARAELGIPARHGYESEMKQQEQN
jgi:hypothetical protein